MGRGGGGDLCQKSLAAAQHIAQADLRGDRGEMGVRKERGVKMNKERVNDA